MADLNCGCNFVEISEFWVWNFERTLIVADNELFAIGIREFLQEDNLGKYSAGCPADVEIIGLHIEGEILRLSWLGGARDRLLRHILSIDNFIDFWGG